jgi:hypothetical protein
MHPRALHSWQKPRIQMANRSHVAMAAREEIWSFTKMRHKCEGTVHELISRTEAVVLFA